MLTDNGADFTRQLFLCFSAVDRKRYEYAELLIWLVIADLEDRLEYLNRSLEYHSEPDTEKRSIIESAICCISQRVAIMNHQLEELDEHRPW
jgi:hypothetical protein